ncbi:BLUF domain-containing protein [Roseomonas sp. CCTCC AB2023176]|uniref:BLUF domain-containing protein n=1 Tax=Roseomonas sp. CCTCC AB2023176 TaxID=3342640 RepID=UPI0035DF9FEB
MSETQPSQRTAPPAPARVLAAPLSMIVYRSRATVAFQAPDLLSLTRAAQARNGTEAVTGIIVFEDSQFFQWLEGPADGLDRVMRSINADGRHADVEVLTHRGTPRRSFADWNMKLGLPTSKAIGRKGEVMHLSRDVSSAMRRSPDAAADWLGRLSPRPSDPTIAQLLETVIRDRVLPELLGHHAGKPLRRVPEHRLTGELAALLVRGDADAISALAAGAAGPGHTSLRHTLFEPAARRIGDAWADDSCTDFDVTLALWRLDTAARLLSSAAASHQGARRSVLVTALPGEPHAVGASLAAASLRRAGWDVVHEMPRDEEGLARLLCDRRYDALDLSLSPALPRTDRLPALARTVALARRVSRNPGIIVAVGGRLFAEGRAALRDVGADLASGALAHLD